MNAPIKYILIFLSFLIALLVFSMIIFGFEDTLNFIGLDRVDFIMKVFSYAD
ncbi:MAG: hypothetical protein PHN56_02780 [Candidatus Nanoarchaeia archaeon]|nr:hypothetical protein [Candidatus Nanoarchaeia archaeon]